MGREYTRSFGSIGQVSPYGPLILFDDFEATLFKWAKAGGSVGSSTSRDTTLAKDGLASLKLDTGAAPAINDLLLVRRLVYGRPSGIYTLETELIINNGGNFDQITFTINDTRPATQLVAGVSINDVAKTILLKGTAGALVAFPGNNLSLLSGHWHRLQLVVNVNTGKYINLTIDSQVFDVSAVSFQSIGGGVLNNIVQIDTRLAVAAQSTINIDNFMLREGTPEF
jgi:hypothetical protein